jgi:hypothetical protein
MQMYYACRPRQLDALFAFIDQHNTQRIGWEAFAHCFTSAVRSSERL